MAENFKSGVIVRLKSGGPDMTVGFVENNMIECYWFDNNKEIHTKYFLEDTLELIDQ